MVAIAAVAVADANWAAATFTFFLLIKMGFEGLFEMRKALCMLGFRKVPWEHSDIKWIEHDTDDRFRQWKFSKSLHQDPDDTC